MPRSRKKTAEFANFICHFGEQELLDHATDIVIPAFLNTQFKRKYGTTDYFLHECSVVNISHNDEAEPAIAGRFIKDTLLSREQIFSAGTIVSNREFMKSAPSAIFLLRLRDHKLIYCRETAHAPSLQEFRSAALTFLRMAHETALKLALLPFKGKRDETSAEARKRINDSMPEPTLEIVSLSSESSISEFLDQFAKLQKIRFTLVDPNHEIDMSGFVRKFRQQSDDLGAKSSEITYSNPEGLAINEAKSQITSASSGNVNIQLKGLDQSGNKLDGNTEKLKMVMPLSDVPTEVNAAAAVLSAAYASAIANRGLRAPNEQAIQRTDSRFVRLLNYFF